MRDNDKVLVRLMKDRAVAFCEENVSRWHRGDWLERTADTEQEIQAHVRRWRDNRARIEELANKLIEADERG